MKYLSGFLLALSILSVTACSPRAGELPPLHCGTTQIVWEIDQSALAQSYLEHIEGDVRATLLSNDISYRDLNAEDGVLRVRIQPQNDHAEAAALLGELPSVIDRDENTDLHLRLEEGGWAELLVTEQYLRMATARALAGQIHFINRRTSELGYEDVTIEKINNHQWFSITPNGPPPRRTTHDFHRRPAILEFRMVDESTSIETALEGYVPVGSEIFYAADGSLTLVRQRSLLDQGHILDVRLSRSFLRQEAIVKIQLDHRGTQILERTSDTLAGGTIAIILDDLIFWRFSVPSHTEGREIHLGSFSAEEEAEQLVQFLNSGDPSAPARVVSETIAPDCEEE